MKQNELRPGLVQICPFINLKFTLKGFINL